MGDSERANFIRGATQRPPGKRQIKPTAIALADIDVEDESDEEFDPEENDSDDQSKDSEVEGSPESEDSDEAEDEEGDDEEADDEEAVSASEKEEDLICTICLGFRQVEGDKVIQCDKCGIAVHEACYAVDDYVDDTASVVSNYSTEPWFCDPCLYGLEEPPHCELCPRRIGAFKRADVGGKYIHLVCALFTSGVSFGVVDTLSAVSWQEVDYRRFGRKSCNACTNQLEARTGIVKGCEAGLCKMNFHISCAQKMGFLVDAEAEHQHHPSSSQEKHIDPHFILCRSHNAPEVIQRKRACYASVVKQEDKRLTKMKFKVLSERENKKLAVQRNHYEKKIGTFKNVTIHLPSMKNKRQRLLQTSAGFLDAFAEKAELMGLTRKEFDASFLQVHPSEIPNMAPSFSGDFVNYYHHRNEVLMKEEQERLDHSHRELAMLHREETDLKKMLEEMKKKTTETKAKHHQQHVDSLYQRFFHFFKQMPIRFDRDNAAKKQRSISKSIEPPAKKKRPNKLIKSPTNPIVLDSPTDPPPQLNQRPQRKAALLRSGSEMSRTNSEIASSVSSPPPILDAHHSRSTSTDGFQEEHPVLLPMISQNGFPKRGTRSKRGLKA